MVELGISKGKSERNFQIHEEKRELVDFMGNPSCGERVDTTTNGDTSHRSEQKKRTTFFQIMLFLSFLLIYVSCA